jgi:hypothetical protein
VRLPLAGESGGCSFGTPGHGRTGRWSGRRFRGCSGRQRCGLACCWRLLVTIIVGSRAAAGSFKTWVSATLTHAVRGELLSGS